MAITFPPFLFSRQKRIRGSARAYFANYIAAGADPAVGAVVSLGPVEDAVSVEPWPTWGEVEGGEEFHAPIDTYLEEHRWKATMTLLEAPIEIVSVLMGGTPTITAGAITASTNLGIGTAGDPKLVAIGGRYSAANSSRCSPEFQFILQVPNEGSTLPCAGYQGFWQIWRAVMKATGPFEYRRKGVTIPIEIEAMYDTSVTVTVASGGSADAVGTLGRYRANYS